MKNLKRIFSLALTGTMLAGMLTIGASAAEFTDADEIVNANAVDTMVALNIINGKDDGSFDPTATVTRAEMAKMITVALNGGKDPVLGTKANPSYTDIGGHWAEKYIEYCSGLGIIAGKGDGTFQPNATVTGTEAAKMMLVAMGYDSTVYKFTGIDWATAVNVEANKTDPKLYDEIEAIDPNAGLSRDNAAQIIYNGVQAKMMVYDPSVTISNGEVTYQYKQSTKSILNEKYGASVFIGTYLGNEKTTNTSDITPAKGEIVVKGLLDTDKSVDENNDPIEGREAAFPSDMDISNIGEEVKVIFKDAKNGKRNAPDKNDTIYGVFNTGATEVLNATKGDVQDNKAAETKIKVDGSKYTLADTVTVYTNYATSAVYTDDAKVTTRAGGISGTKDTANSKLTDDLKGATGDTVKFVMNDEGKIFAAYVVESKLGVVTAKNSTKVTINNGVGTLTIADHDIYDGIAVDDVVVTTVLYKDAASKEGSLVIVEEAEKVSGEVDSYKNQENVKIDGTTYKIYGGTDMTTTGLGSNAEEKFEGEHIGESFDLYLVNGYVAAAVQTTESASNYSVVTAIPKAAEVGNIFDQLQLQVMDSEGTKTIIKVSKDSKKFGSDTKVTDQDDYKVGDIVTYTTNKSGEAVVKIESREGTVAATKYLKATKAFGGTTTATDCILYATNGDGDIKAYSIRSLGNFTAPANKWSKVEKNGKIVALYVDLEDVPAGATSTRVYGIVSEEGITVKVNGTAKEQFIVDVNGEEYTVNLPADSEAIKKGDIVYFDPTSDNVYAEDAIHVITGDAAKLMVAYADKHDENDKTISIFTGTEEQADKSFKGTGRQVLAIADDVKIYYVDQNGDIGSESGSVPTFDTVSPKKNIIVVYSEDENQVKTVETMIVEVSGEKDIINAAAPAPAAHEHTWTEKGTAKAATCTEAGSSVYFVCEVKDCPLNGKHYKTAGDKTTAGTEFGAKEETPEALGHDFTDNSGTHTCQNDNSHTHAAATTLAEQADDDHKDCALCQAITGLS